MLLTRHRFKNEHGVNVNDFMQVIDSNYELFLFTVNLFLTYVT